MTLKNKLVFITGASSGIGRACAHAFAEQGARLLLCARRLDKLQLVSDEIQKKYDVEVKVIQLDVSEREQVLKSIENLPDAWKAIDILVNNAGLALGLETIQDGNIDDWDRMMDTNVKGLLYVTKAVLPQMVAKNAGHIINIGSVAGHVVYPKGVVYCASKYAVNAISNGLRMDLFGLKIRVTTIDPGAVESDFSMVRFNGDAERADAVYQGMTPLTPGDIAHMALYCANCPPHVNISEVIMMPTDQAAATMVARKEK